MKAALGTFLLLGCLGALYSNSLASEFTVVKPSVVQVDGQDQADAKLFTNPEKKIYYVCIQGDSNLYEVDRKDKKVVAVKRSSVLVKPEKCRPIEGAVEQPIEGHLYKDTATGFTFNALTGKKITVAIPQGTR
ncbi:MAG TPA: hypothetical protein VGK27_08915 [Candidatus Deferrimicrobiaceae bacterium]|jgi:hypothetical protein